MSTVTFPTAVGGDGTSVSDDNNPTTGLGNDGHRTRFVGRALTNVVAIANWFASLATATSGILVVHNLGHKALGNVSGTVTLNLAESNYFSATLTGNTTFAWSNFPDSTRAVNAVLHLKNAHLYTVTYPANTRWTGGSPPTLTSNVILSFISDAGTADVNATLSMGAL